MGPAWLQVRQDPSQAAAHYHLRLQVTASSGSFEQKGKRPRTVILFPRFDGSGGIRASHHAGRENHMVAADEPWNLLATGPAGDDIEVDYFAGLRKLKVLRSYCDNPYAVPARATDLAGVAPAHVQTAQYDPLRDEGEEWAERLTAAGSPSTCTRFDGAVHGFVARWEQMSGALAAHDEFGEVLAPRL